MAKFEDKSFSSQDSDGRNFSFYLTKMENELFDEKQNKPNDVWSIKRKSSKQNGCYWCVSKNKELVFEVYESQITKKDAKFLESNLIFLLTAVKQGLNSVVKLKEKIKEANAIKVK